MAKKVVTLLVAFAMIMICGIPVFAANDSASAADGDASKTVEKSSEPSIAEKNQQLVNKIIKDADAETNDNGLVTVKKPEESAVTLFKESYTISGESDKKDVRVYLAKYNEDSKVYLLFANNDGETSWDIGTYGKFAKGITLSKGANKFKLVAVRLSDTTELKSEDVQVAKFTITYYEKNLKDKLVKSVQDGIKDFGDALGKILNNK